MWRISPDAKEGKMAKSYLEALKNYPDLNIYDGGGEVYEDWKKFLNIIQIF